MRALDLDFSGNVAAKWISSVVLALAVLVTAAALFSYLALSESVDQGVAAFQRLDQKTRIGARAASSSVPAAGAEQQKIEVVLARLSVPWDRLLNAIEASVDENSTLIAVEPSLEKGVVTITVEARDLQAMITYQARLEQSAALSDVELVSHQMQIQNPLRPVRFVLKARWHHGGAQ